MRYRKLSDEGDYTAGQSAYFLVDTPETVAQAILTRLRLFTREWFLDRKEGLNLDNILGYGTAGTRDIEVKQRITGTRGVKTLLAYASTVNVATRRFSVEATVETIYGTATVSLNEEF